MRLVSKGTVAMYATRHDRQIDSHRQTTKYVWTFKNSNSPSVNTKKSLHKIKLNLKKSKIASTFPSILATQETFYQLYSSN